MLSDPGIIQILSVFPGLHKIPKDNIFNDAITWTKKHAKTSASSISLKKYIYIVCGWVIFGVGFLFLFLGRWWNRGREKILYGRYTGDNTDTTCSQQIK